MRSIFASHRISQLHEIGFVEFSLQLSFPRLFYLHVHGKTSNRLLSAAKLLIFLKTKKTIAIFIQLLSSFKDIQAIGLIPNACTFCTKFAIKLLVVRLNSLTSRIWIKRWSNHHTFRIYIHHDDGGDNIFFLHIKMISCVSRAECHFHGILPYKIT